MTITLYDTAISPYVQKVKIVLFEKEVSFETRSIDLTAGEQNTDEFGRLTPFRRVPVLQVGDVVLFESSAINEYLEESYPQPPLWPSDLVLRAEARAWERAGDLYGGSLVSSLARQKFLQPEGPDLALVQQHEADAARFLKALDDKLDGREFVAGLFSFADIGLAIHASALGLLGVALKEFTHIDRWLPSITSRDSFKRAQPSQEVIESFLAGRPS